MCKVEEEALETALAVLEKLPEFDPLASFTYYRDKIGQKKHLILVARSGGEAVGCKIGYDRFHDGSFYSWLGGVVPECRKKGVAKLLARTQEDWARAQGYDSIRFKTMNRHKAMLQFAIGSGFQIYRIKPRQALENYRIELIKHLT